MVKLLLIYKNIPYYLLECLVRPSSGVSCLLQSHLRTYILLHLFFFGLRDEIDYIVVYIVLCTYIAEQRTFYGKKVRRSWLLKDFDCFRARVG